MLAVTTFPHVLGVVAMKVLSTVITAVSTTTIEPAIDIATVSAAPCVVVTVITTLVSNIKDMCYDSML